MLWEALQAAGCSAKGWHNGEHVDYAFDIMPDLFTFRRSLPHNDIWPALGHINHQLEEAGYRVTMLAITRDLFATYKSTLRRSNYAFGVSKTLDNSRKAFMKIYDRLNAPESGEIFNISYESFCLHPGYRKWLFENILNLTNPVDFEIKYANEKYYA